MKNPINVFFFAAIVFYFFSCSPKIEPALKRRAILSVKIKPIFKQAIESTNSFDLGLVVKLNNGKTKRKFFRNYYNDDADTFDNDYWENFTINTYNCYFSSGRIYFTRNEINTPDYIAIKIIDKISLATDSLHIKIPKIDSIKIEYQTNTTLSPNFEVPFYIKAYFNNGVSTVISDKSKFETYFGNYEVKVNNQKINYPYFYKIPSETDFKRSFTVTCNHISDSLLKDSVQIPIKYDGHYKFFFQGQKGFTGESGNDGFRRSNNCNGENGQHGEQGQRGARANPVSVLMNSFFIDSNLYIKSIAYSNATIHTCLFDPKYGKLTITNIGGDGGNGGEGGTGADGENQTEKREAGKGGFGGNGGDGGEGGKGGRIKVYADSMAATFFNRIELLNPGGRGGNGGRGGKNGADGIQKNTSFGTNLLLSVLHQVASGRGNKGMEGNNGEMGEEPEFEIVSQERLKQLEERFINR